jgi:hypothetical protein
MNGRSFGLLVAVGIGAAAVVAACGSDGTSSFGVDGGTDGTTVDRDEPMFNQDAGGDGSSIKTLTIQPQNPVLTVTGTPLGQQFEAFDGTTKLTGGQWSIDNVAIGGIDGNGLFTAGGLVGGTAQVEYTNGWGKGSTTVTVKVNLQENPGNVPMQAQMALKNGGAADPSCKFLYPYDKTVFPRHPTPGPVIQFSGTTANYVYVKITGKNLNYEGFYGQSTPLNQVALSDATWKTISLSAGPNDPLSVEITKSANGAVTGPIKQTWIIAQGSLKGTVYYNSYTSPLANNTGATLKVKVGQQAQVLVGNCGVCHAVSSDGSVLTLNYGHAYEAAYDLKSANVPPPIQHQTSDYRYSFPAVYPDGSMVLSHGIVSGGWPPNVPGMSGVQQSRLYDTKTGAQIAAPGWDGVINYAFTPMFSHDGKKLAFNRYEVTSGHTLAVADFDVMTKSFSNITNVFSDNTLYPAWPAFMPDTKSIVFHNGTRSDYATWQGSKADLYILDLATKQVTRLDAADGYAGNQTYLPYGAAEQQLNYEPTTLPIAVGGYYWVVFTSRRYYGNTVTESSQDATRRKKLWVAAIDINATPGKDPSHPAFYLPGQELAAGNMRGFWALDPCKQNGNSCESADECCGGFCRQVNNMKVCVPPPSGCSQEFEKCTVSSDCCDYPKGALCINGHCAMQPPN